MSTATCGRRRLPSQDRVRIVNSAEQGRLDEAREKGVPWKQWGPYLSERHWGTVREDYSDNGDAWKLLHARSGPFARLSLGRRRARRDQRSSPAALLRARLVERQGPDYQRAAVRLEQ